MPERPKKELPPGFTDKTKGGLFNERKTDKQTYDSGKETERRIAERKERIAKIKAEESKIADAKGIISNASKIIEDEVASRVHEETTDAIIYNFVVGEINKKVDGFKIDYNVCRKETLDDFRKYLKAQATAIYQRVLQQTGHVL